MKNTLRWSAIARHNHHDRIGVFFIECIRSPKASYGEIPGCASTPIYTNGNSPSRRPGSNASSYSCHPLVPFTSSTNVSVDQDQGIEPLSKN